jgi:multidrug resistance efflux pump
MKRTFEITFPTFQWREFLTVRFFAILAGLIASFGGLYWWQNIYPFFNIERASLCVMSMEVRSEEEGRLLLCPLDEGDSFQKGQTLFSLDHAPLVERSKELERNIETHRQTLSQSKQRVNQTMEQYVYLQNELSLEGKTSELLDQILGEAQKMQESCFQLEKELSALQNDRFSLEKLIAKRSCAASFEGVVLRRYKQIGDAVSSGEPILLISNPQKRWIEAEIPEAMLLNIHVGSSALIKFPSYPKTNGRAKYLGLAQSQKRVP